MLQRALPILSLTLLLAACSSPPPDEQEAAVAASEQRAEDIAKPATDDDTATGAPPPVDAGACDDVQAQWLIGKTLSEADLLQAQQDAGARNARVLKPGQAVTMDFRADRLTVDVDEKGIISAVRCG